MTDTLKIAHELARSAFANHLRKNGVPYFTHLERVGAAAPRHLRLFSCTQSPEDLETAQAVGLLHDLIEDIPGHDEQTLARAGMSRRIASCVRIVTHASDETYEAYVERIATADDPVVRAVKYADLLDNLNDQPSPKRVVLYANALRRLAAVIVNQEG